MPSMHPWPKVEPGDGPQMRRELHSWQGLERGGRMRWEIRPCHHRGADAGWAAGCVPQLPSGRDCTRAARSRGR